MRAIKPSHTSVYVGTSYLIGGLQKSLEGKHPGRLEPPNISKCLTLACPSVNHKETNLTNISKETLLAALAATLRLKGRTFFELRV